MATTFWTLPNYHGGWQPYLWTLAATQESSLKRLPALTDAARCHLTPLEMARVLEMKLIPGSGMPLAKAVPVPGVTNPRGDIDSECDSLHFSSWGRSRQDTLDFRAGLCRNPAPSLQG
jgi:hypothetical protein